MATMPVSKTMHHGGTCCPACQDILCFHGEMLLESGNHASQRGVLICTSYLCRRCFCPICGKQALHTGGDRYVCPYCNNGVDLFISLYPDGERVHLDVADIHSIGHAPTRHQLIQLAYRKLCGRL